MNEEKIKFSVLMSLYYKEKPEHVKECFQSLLNQSVGADEWVIVEDGPLSKELYYLLEEYQNDYPELIRRIPLEKNRGLGLALKEGIINCKNELIARMDTDDIARKDRFERQLKEFKKNENLDICGSFIYEFEDKKENIISRRSVPITDADIKKYQKKRSAFNHMTVMYKKSSVIEAGNYEHCPLMEDDMLWVRMILNKSICINIPECLVYVRAGKDMLQRRGGLKYFLKFCQARKKIYQLGYMSKTDYYSVNLVQVIVCICPIYIRKIIFKHFLRG